MPAALIPVLPSGLEVLLIPGLLAWAAYATGRVSRPGALGGWIMAVGIYASLGWRGLVPPLVFFIAANLATVFGYAQKAAKGIAQEEGGRRGAKHALANVSAGLIAALVIRFAGMQHDTAWYCAYIATFATAAADTISSEIGQVLGKTPIHPLTFRRLEPGAEGAVSAEGTIAGILGGLLIALSGVAAGLTGEAASLSLVVGVVTFAAAGANWLESALGSVAGARLNNEVMNFFNTVAGGFLAWGLAWYLAI